MRVVIQRVAHASVTIDGVVKSAIGQGLLVLVGFEAADTAEDVAWTTRKLLGLRIFDDEAGVMNRSVLDVGGEVLIVSQFTLHAMTAKGNPPPTSARPGMTSPFRFTNSFWPR
jgi:D-tyrosyl-tRNA(Tyr) deacylase